MGGVGSRRPIGRCTIIFSKGLSAKKVIFVEEIPCSISLNVSREEIYELQEEILDMEVTIYSYEDLLYKNPIDMTNDEKKTYKELKELEKRYNKFEPLERLFSYYLAINEKEN